MIHVSQSAHSHFLGGSFSIQNDKWMTSSGTDNNTICDFWNDTRHIRVLWGITSGIRQVMHVSLHPVITTAFAKLQWYYHKNPKPEYRPYILLVTSVASSCKTFECARTLSSIFRAVLAYSRQLVDKGQIQADWCHDALDLTDLKDREPTEEELKAMNCCEIDILKAHGYSPRVSIPLSFIDKHVFPCFSDNDKKLREHFFRLLLPFLCSSHFFDCSHELIAFVATRIALKEQTIPTEVDKWLKDVQSRFSEKEIEQAKSIFDQVWQHVSKPIM